MKIILGIALIKKRGKVPDMEDFELKELNSFRYAELYGLRGAITEQRENNRNRIMAEINERQKSKRVRDIEKSELFRTLLERRKIKIRKIKK